MGRCVRVIDVPATALVPSRNSQPSVVHHRSPSVTTIFSNSSLLTAKVACLSSLRARRCTLPGRFFDVEGRISVVKGIFKRTCACTYLISQIVTKPQHREQGDSIRVLRSTTEPLFLDTTLVLKQKKTLFVGVFYRVSQAPRASAILYTYIIRTKNCLYAWAGAQEGSSVDGVTVVEKRCEGVFPDECCLVAGPGFRAAT